MKSTKPSCRLPALAGSLLAGVAILSFPLWAQSQSNTRANRPQTPKPAATQATSVSSVPDTGTLTWGNVLYSPEGCVHDGMKAVCTFTFINQGPQGMMRAAVQLLRIQFVDDAHVPHPSDPAYFIDSHGAQQAQLVVNSGDSGTLIREFANVGARVASGEFHLGQQVVAGIPIGEPGVMPAAATAPVTAPASANSPAVAQPVSQPVSPAQPIQPITAAQTRPVASAGKTTTGDPTDQVQQGVNQVKDKKKKAQSLWDQMKGIKK